MSLDLISALKAPWRKDFGFARLFLGCLSMGVPILCFVPMGYVAEYINKMMNGNDELGNIFQHGSKSFVIGLKLFLGLLLLAIPYFLVILILAFVLGDNHPFLHQAIGLVLELIFAFICTIMIISFSCDFKILSMVDFQRAINIVKENPTKALMMGLFVLLISIIYSIVFIVPAILFAIIVPMSISLRLPVIIPAILVIIAIILVFILIFASIISMYNISGQYARESQYIQSIKKELA